MTSSASDPKRLRAALLVAFGCFLCALALVMGGCSLFGPEKVATSKVDGAPVTAVGGDGSVTVLATLDRGATVRLDDQNAKPGDFTSTVPVTVDGKTGTVLRVLVSVDGDPAFDAFMGYTREGAPLYRDYARSEVARVCELNEELSIADEYGEGFVVEADGAFLYIRQADVRRVPYEAGSIGSISVGGDVGSSGESVSAGSGSGGGSAGAGSDSTGSAATAGSGSGGSSGSGGAGGASGSDSEWTKPVL